MKKSLFFATAIIGLGASIAFGASIVGSRHDLKSVWEKGQLVPGMKNNLNYYDEICIYCHTPHNATVNIPLWNRNNPTGPFQMYTASRTMDSKPGGVPSQVSLLCLSCHDGTIAVDSIVNTKTPVYTATSHGKMVDDGSSTNCGRCHNGDFGHDSRKSYLGKNLTDDHPISMAYPSVIQDGDFVTPADPKKGWSNIKLYDGKVECASCHNVHDPGITPFLRTVNSASVLCLKCHTK